MYIIRSLLNNFTASHLIPKEQPGVSVKFQSTCGAACWTLERCLDHGTEWMQVGLGGTRDVCEDTGTKSVREEVLLAQKSATPAVWNDAAVELSLCERRRKAAWFALTFRKQVEKGSELHQKALERLGKTTRLGKKLWNWGGKLLGCRMFDWRYNPPKKVKLDINSFAGFS